ncbi:hypothetical protein [Stakelama pacifica]|uniref:Uncharacterized protein n=1 Tax=Stakelama pacifica TaxID=517720 RepID=A0A4R6F9U3_9SPHN|nr:hypothetical protein [Stakelama pacifica]TDN77851.1 hypothetical protein EV664_12315 [Stakelama pacifica]GGP00667.1 hypothetical protein GCM10011329_37080 [Stakelama pacifica]
MNSGTGGTGPVRGRPDKSQAAKRRLRDMEKLERDESVWDWFMQAVRHGELDDPAEIEKELTELLDEIAEAANPVQVPRHDQPTQENDKKSNPEGSLLQALERGRWVLSIRRDLDRLNDRIQQLRHATETAEAEVRWQICEALAQREPAIDREVLRRARQLEAAGVNRASVSKIRQDAERAWKNPASWSDLPPCVGRVRFEECEPNPDQIEVIKEPLPPLRHLSSYGVDENLIEQRLRDQSADSAFAYVHDRITSWMTKYYARRSKRSNDTIAWGWAVLLLVGEIEFDQLSSFPNLVLSSPWIPEKILKISREPSVATSSASSNEISPP